MAPLREENAKRKASDEPQTPTVTKRVKNSNSHTPDTERKPIKVVPFPEKPAVVEERNGEIEFRVVNNDNSRESLIILTGLKCIFQKQLPKMPKDYIARLVYDRTHLSMAIVKKPLEVVGGITYRPFKGRQFAEIVFCAISSDQQVKGYGAHLMSHLKDYVKATSDVMHFLTYADNYAIGYFKKQGFTKEITLDKPRWMGYIKDYEGGTIMQCTMVPKIRYLEIGRMLLKQKEAVHAKVRSFSKSHVVHHPPKEWKSGVCKIDPMQIPAIKESGWSPDMDELARQPRHGPNFNQLMHLLNDLQNHQSAWPFAAPVNKDEVADYYEVIKEPMDLSTMEEKHAKDLYPTPEDFIKDAKLIFNNCRRYNNETTPYAKSANRLEKFMWSQIKAIPEWSVTDSRDPKSRQPARRRSPLGRHSSTRLISVDNVLQYASEIPSGQQRTPPGRRQPMSQARPTDPRLVARLASQHMPSRTTKLSEKLVLLPETVDERDEADQTDLDLDPDAAPPRDDEEALRAFKTATPGKSYAERLPKARRTEKLARVTAYCTAETYKMKDTASFVRDHHGARTKLYDDCLYTVYHLPLLPGSDGYRIRSSPILKNPGGKSVLDEEIERSEQRDYHEGYFGDVEEYGVRSGEANETPGGDQGVGVDGSPTGLKSTRTESPTRADAFTFAEMFVFSYGVAVFWNFTERQEKDILADLTFSESESGFSLVAKPQQEEDFETEEFHFEYSPHIPRPRVFNDMITLRSGDHMIKLAMSHAIAQSTKLSFFEERMAHNMDQAQYIPRKLALTGKLGMGREEVVKILGRLFKSRVDVNLSSNMLDVPNFFWDAEPTLHPLYIAVREYLEIKPRVQVLNERCRVFLDLAAILSDSIADQKMSRITWIIIILILLSIVVTCSEVFLRFGILSTRPKSLAQYVVYSGIGLYRLAAMGGGHP
ncbi:MAG: histone acetyltransferase [Piccolia ochrophora]|nr:MAG: histone acetyltransferase [Piccolia ochrophora]